MLISVKSAHRFCIFQKFSLLLQKIATTMSAPLLQRNGIGERLHIVTRNKVSKITGHIFSFLSRFRYHIVIILGVLIVGVLDENSFRRRVECYYQIKDLNTEIDKYEKMYQHDTERLRELKRSPRAIAKIARERYFMKADDEDIFVLSDDEQPLKGKNQYETTE